jgi:predicted PurR-regulated permease PerM
MKEEKILDISWGTILKIGIAVFLFYFIYLLKDILIWFIFALIISVLFNPAIDFFQRRKVPRSLAVVFVYVALFGILGFSIYQIVPIFISEIQQFLQLFPQYFENIAPPLKDLGINAFQGVNEFNSSLAKILESVRADIFGALFVIFGGIFSTIFIFSVAIFISLEENGMEKAIKLLAPKKYESYVLDHWVKCQNKVSGWFGARILTSIFVGLATYLTLRLFEVEYAVSLSFFAGVSNIVTILGPILAGAVITILVALQSWGKAIFVLAAFFLIQQIEGNIFTPILTRKFIGLPPALVLISVIIGFKLWGVLGAILAIPIIGILFEFSRDFLKKRKEEQVEVL